MILKFSRLFFLVLIVTLPYTAIAAESYTYLEPPGHDVVAASFTQDSKRIISIDYKGVLLEWDFLNDRIVQRREMAKEVSSECVLLTPDGDWAAVADVKAEVTLHNVQSGFSKKISCPLQPDTGDKKRFPSAIAISGDAKKIYLIDNYGALYRSLDGKAFVPFGPLVTTYSRYSEPTAMTLSPVGTTIALSKGGEVITIDTVSGETLATMRHTLAGVANRISFSADGRYVTAGIPIRFSAGVAVSEFPVWEAATGRLVQSVDFNDGLPYYAGFSRDGKYLFTAASQYSSIIERSNGRQIARFEPKRSRYHGMSESADGGFLLIAESNGVQLYDYRQLLAGKTPPPLVSLGKRRPDVQALAFSPDNTSLLISYSGTPLQQFDLKKGRLEKLESTDTDYLQLDFSSDGTRLFGFGRDGMAIWSYPSMEKIKQADHSKQTYGVLYSDDSSQALVLDSSYRHNNDWYTRTIRYDMKTGKILKKTLLENLPTRASMNDLICADFAANKAVFQMHSAFLYSLDDGSILQEFPYPPAKEKQWLSDWESSWRFDCASMTFIPTTALTKNALIPSKTKWHYASTRDGKTRAIMYLDVMDKTDASVRLYDRDEKEIGRFATFVSPLFGGNNAQNMVLSDNGALLAIGTERGDVGLYETATGKLMGRYYFFTDKEWAWVAADGALNGSDKGKNRMHKVAAPQYTDAVGIKRKP